MFMRIFAPRLLFFLGLTWTSTAVGQNPGGTLIPSGPQDDDLDEVEDVVDDTEFLPHDETVGGKPAERAATIRSSQAAELSLSQDEMRARHTYAAGIGLGSGKPWQLYSLEWGYFIRSDWLVTLFGGGGEFKESGVREDRSYDVTVRSRGMGLSTRYYFSRFERLSVEALLGYAAWDGEVKPQGAAADGAIAEKLDASFQTTGIYYGFSAGFTWLWDSGTYIEWTPLGVRSSRIMQKNYSRESEFVEKAVARTVERGEFYGLTNIEVGYLF